MSNNQSKLKNITDNIYFLKNEGFEQEDRQYTGTIPLSGLWFHYNHQSNGGKAEFQNFSMNSSKKKNQCSIIALNNDEANVSIKRGAILSSSIILDKEFLLKNLPKGITKENIIKHFDTNKPGELLTQKDINPQAQLLLNTLYNNPFNSQLDELYAQSKILELIYLEFQSLIDIEPNKNNKLKLDDYDIEAIKKAKEILVKNMKNPPSIIELSHMIGINEFKLKSGFKTIFNDTPYNILLDYKLEYAKELLLASDMNVGEIAKQTGYKYIQSFTKAFVKKYGVRPIDIMKKRKYYY